MTSGPKAALKPALAIVLARAHGKVPATHARLVTLVPLVAQVICNGTETAEVLRARIQLQHHQETAARGLRLQASVVWAKAQHPRSIPRVSIYTKVICRLLRSGGKRHYVASWYLVLGRDELTHVRFGRAKCSGRWVLCRVRTVLLISRRCDAP